MARILPPLASAVFRGIFGTRSLKGKFRGKLLGARRQAGDAPLLSRLLVPDAAVPRQPRAPRRLDTAHAGDALAEPYALKFVVDSVLTRRIQDAVGSVGVIDEGRLREIGTHEEIKAKESLRAKMVRIQQELRGEALTARNP